MVHDQVSLAWIASVEKRVSELREMLQEWENKMGSHVSHGKERELEDASQRLFGMVGATVQDVISVTQALGDSYPQECKRLFLSFQSVDQQRKAFDTKVANRKSGNDNVVQLRKD